MFLLLKEDYHVSDLGEGLASLKQELNYSTPQGNNAGNIGGRLQWTYLPSRCETRFHTEVNMCIGGNSAGTHNLCRSVFQHMA